MLVRFGDFPPRPSISINTKSFCFVAGSRRPVRLRGSQLARYAALVGHQLLEWSVQPLYFIIVRNRISDEHDLVLL